MDAFRPQSSIRIGTLRDGTRSNERDPLQRQLGRRPLGTEAYAMRLAALLGLVSVLVGCGDDQPEPSRGGAGSPSSGGDAPMVPEQVPPRSPPGSCGLDQPAFCEDFESPSPGGRSGDLDESRFSFARWGHETREHFVRVPASTEPATLYPS